MAVAQGYRLPSAESFVAVATQRATCAWVLGSLSLSLELATHLLRYRRRLLARLLLPHRTPLRRSRGLAAHLLRQLPHRSWPPQRPHRSRRLLRQRRVRGIFIFSKVRVPLFFSFRLLDFSTLRLSVFMGETASRCNLAVRGETKPSLLSCI